VTRVIVAGFAPSARAADDWGMNVRRFPARPLILATQLTLFSLAAHALPARADLQQAANPQPASVQFQQPDGWTKSAAPDGHVFFLSPTTSQGFRPNININDSGANYFDELSAARSQLPSAGAQIEEDDAIPCSSFQNGDRLSYTMPVQGRTFSFIQIIVGDQTSLHVVTYTRLAGSDPDPAALHALESFCS
jgi:hypothetical protein